MREEVASLRPGPFFYGGAGQYAYVIEHDEARGSSLGRAIHRGAKEEIGGGLGRFFGLSRNVHHEVVHGDHARFSRRAVRHRGCRIRPSFSRGP